jgi:hypothetical protein
MDPTCGHDQRARSNAKDDRRSLCQVRHNDAGHRNEERPSARQTASTSIIAIAIFAPELANLTPDDNLAWAIYLSLNEAVKGLLCLALGLTVPRLRYYGFAAAVWFVTQAMDEMTNGNLFTEHTYEYPLLTLLGIAAYIATRK